MKRVQPKGEDAPTNDQAIPMTGSCRAPRRKCGKLKDLAVMMNGTFTYHEGMYGMPNCKSRQAESWELRSSSEACNLNGWLSHIVAHAFVDLRPDCALGDTQVIVHLQPKPPLRSWCTSMVVDDFDIIGIALPPDKAGAPLVIDTDAVLSLPITM